MRKKGVEVKVEQECSVDVDVDAYIGPDYIANELVKLDTYKKIAGLLNETECSEMEDELNDRFGKLPQSVTNLIDIVRLKILAKDLGITDVRGLKGEITITFLQNAPIKVENIGQLLRKHNPYLKLNTKGLPIFVYKYYPTGEVLSDEQLLLKNTRMILQDMHDILL